MKFIFSLFFLAVSGLAHADETAPVLATEVEMDRNAPAASDPATVDVSYSHFHYSEEKMANSGQMLGVSGRYDLALRGNKVIFEAGYMSGHIKYDGQTWSGKPITATGRDYIFTTKASYAFPSLIDSETSEIRPFVGGGVRYLNDRLEGPGSYEREITYLYLPGGVDGALGMGKSWKMVWRAELDILVSGTVKTHLDDVNSRLPTVENHQSAGSGLGLNLETSFRFRPGTLGFHITPYMQYWKVDDSERQYVSQIGGEVYEPKNETMVVGLKTGVVF